MADPLSDATLAADYWRSFVALWQADKHHEDGQGAFDIVNDGVFLRIYSHLPQFWRHQALLLDADRPADDFSKAIADLIEGFRGSRGPLILSVAPGTENRVNNPLVLQGFRRAGGVLVMGRELAPSPLAGSGSEKPGEPHVHPVSEYIELATARALIGEVFDTPLVIRNYLVDDLPYTPYIVEVNRIVVAAAVLVPAGDTAGIYSVATLPQYRGRGYATTLVDRMVADTAAQGYRSVTLSCLLPMERHYARSGFRTVGTAVGYVCDA